MSFGTAKVVQLAETWTYNSADLENGVPNDVKAKLSDLGLEIILTKFTARKGEVVVYSLEHGHVPPIMLGDGDTIVILDYGVARNIKDVVCE